MRGVPRFRAPVRRSASARGPAPAAPLTAARALAAAALCACAVGASVVAVVPVARSIRDARCSHGPQGCEPASIRRSDLGTCRVISHVDAVFDDTVVYADDLGAAGDVVLSRSIDKDAVVHWFVEQGSKGAPESTVREFADEDTAREAVVAAVRAPVVAQHSRVDGTGITAWLGTGVDGHREGDAPPTAIVVRRDSRVAGASAGQTAPATEPVPVLDVDHRSPPRRRSTVWELPWRAAVNLDVARGDGGGRVLLTVDADPAGPPNRISLDIAGRLARLLLPGPDEAAAPKTLERLVGVADANQSVPARLVLGIDLTAPGGQAAATDLLQAAQALPALTGDSAPSAGPAQQLPAPTRTAALRRAYRWLDATPTGASVTVTTFRDQVPARRLAGAEDLTLGRGVDLGSRGQLTLVGAVPDASWYLAPGSGMARWQECR
jgi:hypothetical protein